jgi:aquaporin Z
MTVGLAIAGRHPRGEVVQYVVAQVLGGIAGAAILYVIATGKAGAEIGGFATNGSGDRSPGKYGLVSALVIEVVMTFGFVTIILGATEKRVTPGMAGLVIGLALTLIHLVTIPVTNTSVNPARSTAPALFVGGAALSQLWLF